MQNSIIATGWKNKQGTGERNCKCGSWKQHWINFSKRDWPKNCSVNGCSNSPQLGGHIINSRVSGEKIVPLCDSCNKRTETFTLRGGVVLVSANTSETCEKR